MFVSKANMVSRNYVVRFCWFSLLSLSRIYCSKPRVFPNEHFVVQSHLWTKFLIMLLFFYQIDCALQYLICCHSYLMYIKPKCIWRVYVCVCVDCQNISSLQVINCCIIITFVNMLGTSHFTIKSFHIVTLLAVYLLLHICWNLKLWKPTPVIFLVRILFTFCLVCL